VQDLEGKMIYTTSGEKYMLTEILGEGAQGIVYEEATDKFLIKLYKKDTPIQNQNKLKKLKWLMAQDYPDQFIKPLGIIEEPYIGYVMEKVKGHSSLNRLLVPSRDVTFSEWYNKETGGLRRRLYLAYKIAMQFALLHETNRAYCDISGTNILVNEDPKVASVCMIDIDNIYIPGGESGNVLGTSRYMAPEIIKKQMVPDIFTDSYSLAVILFELLRVGHPYVGDIVDDGTPEQQEHAYLGMYPYVDDPDADLNRSSQMLPSEVVFTENLAKLFEQTFIAGKENRMARATAKDFALACLEASNKVMKCPVCENWHIAKPNKQREYICPWCDDANERPMFIQFKDRYDVSEQLGKKDNTLVNEDVSVNSFVLRREKNSITDNYVTDFYVKRDKFAKQIDMYFTIRLAKDGNFYLINDSGKELYLYKPDVKKKYAVTQKLDPIPINKGDYLFFDDVWAKEKEVLSKKTRFKGVLYRYAILR
jgi:DNA-binding helix-hairpin-helix protein with protein kinase domain